MTPRFYRILLLGIIVVGSISAVWAVTSFSAAVNDQRLSTVGLMVQRLDGKQVNAQPLVVDQTYLGSFPKLATAIEKSDNLIDPVLGPRAYQDRLSQVEADAIMNTLNLQHVNTADNYDDQGNKIGTVELYSTLVQLNGKSYGITLVFQK